MRNSFCIQATGLYEEKVGFKPVSRICEIFGTDMDPHPQIRTSDKRIRIRLWFRILLCSSVIFKMQTKNYFFLISFAYLS
jgi:hypothetical protein